MGMYCSLYAVSQEEMNRIRFAPEVIDNFPLDKSKPSADLQKAWHGLHYLLTGTGDSGEPPLNFLLLGGEAVGGDCGAGPVRFLSPDEVRKANEALSAIRDDLLWFHFDPEEMTAESIYPEIWEESEEELRDEYTSYFQELKTFLQQATESGLGALIQIS